MDALDPALFIGSSSEGVAIARELQAEVDEQCEPTVWSQDVFQPGGTPLSALLTAALNADFAALVLTPDDSVMSRGEQRPAARDNVIFELGLFSTLWDHSAYLSSVHAAKTFICLAI